jgi:nitrogen regulatory protein PII
MKMLMLVFRQSLEDDLLQLLEELDVKGFTETPKVHGKGETGKTFQTFGWPGYNSMIMAAMEDEQADLVVKRLKIFSSTAQRRQHVAKIPLRLFAIPCECLI